MFKELIERINNKKGNTTENYEDNVKMNGDSSCIRLYYVAMEKFFSYGTDEEKIGKTFGISSPFILPDGMTLEESCKVISYLSEKIESENDLPPACEKSVAKVSNILSDYGFNKVEGYSHGHFHSTGLFNPTSRIITAYTNINAGHIEGVTDLFTIGGDLSLFEKSDLNKRYFDWFSEGVSEQEVQQIYDRLGLKINENNSQEK